MGGEQAQHGLRVERRNPVADTGAHVLAVSAVALVAQFSGHQQVPEPGDTAVGEGLVFQGLRKSEAGQGGDDDVEKVLSPSAMGRGIRQERDQREQLNERVRPAMTEHERHRGRPAGTPCCPDVHKVDQLALDPGGELREGTSHAARAGQSKPSRQWRISAAR